MKVVTLITCPEERRSTALLVLDSLRVGFPTAKIEVWLGPVSASVRDHVVGRLAKLAERGPAELETVNPEWYADDIRNLHGRWLNQVILRSDDTETIFVVDPDVTLLENCEPMWQTGRLICGRLMPKMHLFGSIMEERLHPSFLVFPRPAELRKKLRAIVGPTWYARGFEGFSVPEQGRIRMWDTGAALYAWLRDSLRGEGISYFSTDELSRYEHRFLGTLSGEQLAALDVPMAATMRQAPLDAQAKAISERSVTANYLLAPIDRTVSAWTYYSGILSHPDGTPYAAVCYAEFETLQGRWVHGSYMELREAGGRWTWAYPITDDDIYLPPSANARFTLYDPARERLDRSTWMPLEREGGGTVLSSDPQREVSLHLRFPDGTVSNVTAKLWCDRERGEIPLGKPWRWGWIAAEDGAFWNFYEIDGECRVRYTPKASIDINLSPWMGATLSVGVAETRVPTEPVEIALEIPAHHLKLRMLPVTKDQWIDDRTVAHLRYWDGACRLLGREGGQIGWGWFEDVPAGWGRQIPGEWEMALRWCKGNQDAAHLLYELAVGSQMVDDVVDGDVDPSPSARSAKMLDILGRLWWGVEANPFYRQHTAALAPVLRVALAYWDASNEWAHDWKLDTRRFAWVHREAFDAVVVCVADLVGGMEWARTVVREVHSYYHFLRGEQFEEWEFREFADF